MAELLLDQVALDAVDQVVDVEVAGRLHVLLEVVHLFADVRIGLDLADVLDLRLHVSEVVVLLLLDALLDQVLEQQGLADRLAQFTEEDIDSSRVVLLESLAVLHLL